MNRVRLNGSQPGQRADTALITAPVSRQVRQLVEGWYFAGPLYALLACQDGEVEVWERSGTVGCLQYQCSSARIEEFVSMDGQVYVTISRGLRWTRKEFVLLRVQEKLLSQVASDGLIVPKVVNHPHGVTACRAVKRYHACTTVSLPLKADGRIPGDEKAWYSLGKSHAMLTSPGHPPRFLAAVWLEGVQEWVACDQMKLASLEPEWNAQQGGWELEVKTQRLWRSCCCIKLPVRRFFCSSWNTCLSLRCTNNGGYQQY